MDDFKDITIANTIVIGISEHAQRFGFPKKYLPLLNLIDSIIVSFFLVKPLNIKNMIFSTLFLTLTSTGMNEGMKKLGKKMDKLKKDR